MWAESDVSLRAVAVTGTSGEQEAVDLVTITPVVLLTAAVRRVVFTVFVVRRRSVTFAAPVSTRDKPTQPVPQAATTSESSLLMLLLKLRDWRWKKAHNKNITKTRNVLDCDQSNDSSHIIFSCTFTLETNIRIGPDGPYQRYGHSKLCKTADGRDLGFGPTGSSAIRSADLENPTLEPKTKRIRLSVAEIWPFEIFQNARSVGRRSSILYIVLIHSSRYVRNVAR